ncbi:unnamed protein product [Prorocentrum cordatum]|uniref:Uncharacterized protein n=1 Tax=Prorocentrum cordatum TaxID=2364126 RepID=A0ABN9U0V0_9DINO|nr:unnamed protein product [Polarella glacialis]
MERGGRRREEEEEEEDLDVRAVRLPGRKRARGRAGRRRARGPLPASPPDWQRVCPPPGLGGAPMTGKAQKARRSLAAGLPSRLGIQRGENTRGPDFAGTKKGEEEERREGFGVRVNVRVAHCTFDWHSCTASLGCLWRLKPPCQSVPRRGSFGRRRQGAELRQRMHAQTQTPAIMSGPSGRYP